MERSHTSFEPFFFHIERGKIKEFARAIGDGNPIYTDIQVANSKEYRDIPVPPTFATVMEMWAGADFDTLVERLQLNPLKVLHGEQQYRYLEDICAGDRLRGETKVMSIEEKRGMKLITLETTYFNQENRPVLIATAVIIETP